MSSKEWYKARRISAVASGQIKAETQVRGSAVSCQPSAVAWQATQFFERPLHNSHSISFITGFPTRVPLLLAFVR